MPVRRSLAIWAGLAIFLVVFSYIFTLLLAAACVYLPFLLVSSSPNFTTLLIFLAGIVVALVIVWSLLPRRDVFTPPGPRLDAREQPRLFAELAAVAGDLGESLPREVYLVADVNAWVSERGGMMGFGSRRVMGLGLPLLRILTISQFRAVLAHEFGHYYSGDTRLWPWVHKTRAAMARTLGNLGSDSVARALSIFQLSRLLHHLAVVALVWYWKIFLRVTQAISRRHEYRADELAAHLAGPQALIDGLSAVRGASAALAPFWQTEMIPAMQAGYRPSFSEGFARFIVAPAIGPQISKHVEDQLKQAATDPFDTHPALRDRVAALREQSPRQVAVDDTPAIALLDSLDQMELALLQTIVSGLNVTSLKPMAWDRIGSEAYLPAWRTTVGECSTLLAKYTLETLPELVANLNELSNYVRDPAGMLLTREQRTERAAQVVWRAVTLALIERGWEFHATPGVCYLERDGSRILPHEVVTQMRSKTLRPEEWKERCRVLGIAPVALSY